MLRRIRLNGGMVRGEFERQALMITGWAFYILTAGLVVTAVLSLHEGHRPASTFWIHD